MPRRTSKSVTCPLWSLLPKISSDKFSGSSMSFIYPMYLTLHPNNIEEIMSTDAKYLYNVEETKRRWGAPVILDLKSSRVKRESIEARDITTPSLWSIYSIYLPRLRTAVQKYHLEYSVADTLSLKKPQAACSLRQAHRKEKYFSRDMMQWSLRHIVVNEAHYRKCSYRGHEGSSA